MRVVEDERAADALAVVEDDRAARVAQPRQLRVGDRATIHTLGLSRNRSNRVQVVDRVIRNLQTRRALEKRPVVPRLVDDDAHVDVHQRAEHTLIDEVA